MNKDPTHTFENLVYTYSRSVMDLTKAVLIMSSIDEQLESKENIFTRLDHLCQMISFPLIFKSTSTLQCFIYFCPPCMFYLPISNFMIPVEHIVTSVLKIPYKRTLRQ